MDLASSAASFEKQLKFGKMGESAIANWFKRKGYTVLPVYEVEMNTGKGPQVFMQSAELVAPDMLCFNGEKVFWIEAKHKSVFSWYRKEQRWETGIDLHHYEDYLQVAEKSPWPVWLMFLHYNGYTEEPPHHCPTGLFGRKLSYLQEHVSHESDRHGRHGMVYWAHETLLQIATLEEVICVVEVNDG